MGFFGKGKNEGGTNTHTDDTHFSLLAAACDGATSNEPYRNFWKAMFNHPEWHFLNDARDVAASLERGEMPGALLGLREPSTNRLALAVFTSGTRANAYHNASKSIGEGETTLSLCMSPSAAVAYLAQMGDDVSGIIANYGPHDFAPSLTLEQLVLNYEFDTGDLPEEAWPRFTRGVTMAGSNEGWDRLYAQLVKLPVWVNPTFEEAPSKPVVHMQGDDVMLVFYTHKRYAEQAGALGRIPGTDVPGMGRGDGHVGLRINEVAPAEMMGHLEHFSQQLEPGKNLAVLFNAGVEPFGMHYSMLRDAWGKSAA